MKNVNIAHHPFRGDFTVLLHKSVVPEDVEPYFKAEQDRICITGGLVYVSSRGIRIQRLGQGVFLEPNQVQKIKVGWRKIWPENKFLQFIKTVFAKIARWLKKRSER